jgi:starvation-inducible DNA-binding protein
MATAAGLGDNQRKAIADALARALADTYVLKVKTHGFHWNVKGQLFGTLHAMFEEQYTALEAAVDEIAERIRALRVDAPGSMAGLLALSSVREEAGSPAAMDMIRQLAADNETAARTANDVLRLAEEAGDEATVDLMVERTAEHEKFAWMLRSHLEG